MEGLDPQQEINEKCVYFRYWKCTAAVTLAMTAAEGEEDCNLLPGTLVLLRIIEYFDWKGPLKAI